MIVPEQDLIGMEFRPVSSTDKGEDIAAEEHFHYGDATTEF
jgi:hypothetical protein